MDINSQPVVVSSAFISWRTALSRTFRIERSETHEMNTIEQNPNLEIFTHKDFKESEMTHLPTSLQ